MSTFASSSASAAGSQSSASTASLRDCVKSKILDQVFASAEAKSSSWMVLIMCDRALRVVNSVVGMYDIMERRITTVEQLKRKRQPLPELDGVYLVDPSQQSIDQILADFSNPKKPMYNNVHLFFLTPVSDAQMTKIKKAKLLLSKIKTFSEINIDFLALEANSFHLDMNSCFKELVCRTPNSMAHKVIAAQLVTVCATLNEYPHIRFKQSSSICCDIAQSFHEQMNEFVAKSPDWWYNGGQGHTERDRSTMLLLDRCDDPLSPLIHEFTYQAMVNDLLPIEEGKITYTTDINSGKSESKDVLLNENDELWRELKDMHIADVIEMLSSQIREMMSNNSGAALAKDSGASLSLSEMASAMKQFPEFRETMAKLSQHMHISHQCMDKFNKQNLLELSELEQTMATGLDSDNKAPKSQKLMDDLVDTMVSLNNSKKAVRVIMIYIISQQGIKEEDRGKLFSAAGLSEEEKSTILSLDKIGVTLQQAKAPSRSFTSMFRSQKLTKTGRNDKNSEYAMSRYVSNLKGVLEQLVEDKLSIDDYPSILPLPSGGSGGVGGSARSVRRDKQNNKWGNSTSEKKYSGGRNLVFMIGGLCYSELRSASEVMKSSDKEFICGSTNFLKPDEFLDAVASL